MSKNALIRVATTDDAAEILEIYRPYIEKTAVTFEEEVPGLDDFKKRMENIMADCPYLVCEIDGVVVGYAYATVYRARASYRWNKEVSVYIHKDFHRKNIGRALYTALFQLLKMQNIGNLLAVITLPNEASASLHESFGFKPCAVFNKVGYKLQRWHQVGWWELSFIETDETVPSEPIPFSRFQNTTNIDSILKKAAAIVKIS